MRRICKLGCCFVLVATVAIIPYGRFCVALDAGLPGAREGSHSDKLSSLSSCSTCCINIHAHFDGRDRSGRFGEIRRYVSPSH